MAARRASPVEMAGMPYFAQMFAAWVPFPAPGAPNKISFMLLSPPYQIEGVSWGLTSFLFMRF
jgi:hypothetical protein